MSDIIHPKISYLLTGCCFEAHNRLGRFLSERQGEIILEIKAKRLITKEDFYQMLRYLKSANIKLGLIINFRNRYLKPKRIINV